MYLVLFALCLIFRMCLCLDGNRKCRPVDLPVVGHALKKHTFETIVVQNSTECQVLCHKKPLCQSYNFFMPGKMCELNNRTKEAWPDDFVSDNERFYKRKWPDRVRLGSIQQLPGESCVEISANEEGYALSGEYWLSINGGANFQVYCDMTHGSKGWTLIARFANNDMPQWLDDTGYWWYDKTEPAGDTTNPSTTTDMISPAFWLLRGNELKITRSDDSRHTALLQTTSDCLDGQTFRSKITSYGNFRNGASYAGGHCLGKCVVQYDGKYKSTVSFDFTSCNGSRQQFNYIGFWCSYGAGGSVMMIGGGGYECGGATHGIAVTGSRSSFFAAASDRPEKDFASNPWFATVNYALNLWIRGKH